MRHSAGAWSEKTSEAPIFRTGAQKETVSRFGAGAAENWPVIWFGLEYALTVDVGRCGHGDR